MDFDIATYEPGGSPQSARFRFQASPLVSCLMATRGGAALCSQAIGMFQAQTYGHRELVIVSQRADAEVREVAASVKDPRVRFVHAPASNLGALRNASVAAARGDLVCQWDDDDLYDRQRLEVMVSALAATKAEAVFLARVTLWWPGRRQLALSEARLWEGTMLAVKDKIPRYPDLDKGEDTAMVDELRARARIAALDAPGAYVYRMTGQNTWNAAHFEGLFARASANLAPEYDARTRTWPISA